MPWLQISLESPSDEIDRVSAALLEAGALSITLGDAADQPIYEPMVGETRLWTRTRVTGLFEVNANLQAIQQHLAALLPSMLPLQTEILPDQAWERAWLEHFHPRRFGQRLWISPSNQPPKDAGPEAILLRLDPGLAFGTGTHSTTALCLEWLEQADLDNTQVIDYGCGSGILGIAAILLGAQYAWCVDNDPQALTATRDNAAKNGVSASISECSPEHFPDVQADLLVANILAKPLIELNARLASCTRRGGQIVLCGILSSQAEEVLEAYCPYFRIGKTAEREGWIRLVGTRY